jgi:hypothetical protein
VVDPFKPVELSLLTNPAKSDGEWSTSIQPKAKMNFIPTGIGKLGVSAYAGGSFDVATGEHLTAFAVIYPSNSHNVYYGIFLYLQLDQMFRSDFGQFVSAASAASRAHSTLHGVVFAILCPRPAVGLRLI